VNANDNREPTELIVSFHEDEPATAWISIYPPVALYPVNREEARKIANKLLAFANLGNIEPPSTPTFVTRTQPHDPIRHEFFVSSRKADDMDELIRREIAALVALERQVLSNLPIDAGEY
jgi:hypothetical protein